MNCARHPESMAIGFCCSCGRAICANCHRAGSTGKLACSPECEKEIAERDSALRLVLTRTTRSTKGAGIFTIVLGALFSCLGIYHLLFDRHAVLIGLGFTIGLVFIVSGIILVGIAKKK